MSTRSVRIRIEGVLTDELRSEARKQADLLDLQAEISMHDGRLDLEIVGEEAALESLVAWCFELIQPVAESQEKRSKAGGAVSNRDIEIREIEVVFGNSTSRGLEIEESTPER